MYPDTHCDIIKPGDNVIVGLGDSFTQGVGAYDIDIWKSMPSTPSTYNISGQHFVDEQGKNNWVRQLVNNHLPGYKVYNLGVNGGGNRATIRELYMNPLPPNLGNVIVILMATGVERYDFLKQKDDYCGNNWHQKWQTIWPTVSDRGPISRLEKDYLELIWSPRNDAFEFLFNVRDAQNYCNSNGYKFMFASAFDVTISKKEMIKSLEDKSEFIDIANWNDFVDLHPYKSFIDMLNQMEGNRYMSMHEIFKVRAESKVPTKYITPCSHWSIDGCKKVAEYLFEVMKKRGIV
jgi:hypothetical protein